MVKCHESGNRLLTAAFGRIRIKVVLEASAYHKQWVFSPAWIVQDVPDFIYFVISPASAGLIVYLVP